MAAGAIDVQTVPAAPTPPLAMFSPDTTPHAAPTPPADAPAQAEPAAAPVAELTPQQQAQAIVEGEGFDLVQFCAWAARENHMAKPFPPEWAALDEGLAKRCIRARIGLLTGLRKMFPREDAI